MKILLLNPNTTSAITERIKEAALKYSTNSIDVDVRQISRGPSVIESAYDEVIAAYYTVEELKKMEGLYDAMIIGCFADPGLAAAREVIKVPVVGMFEAALHEVLYAGNLFSIISSCGSADIEAFTIMVRARGMSEALASVHCIDVGVNGVTEESSGDIKRLVQNCIKKDGARGVILGCAAFAGFAARLTEETGILVTDGIAASIYQANMLAEMQQHKSSR